MMDRSQSGWVRLRPAFLPLVLCLLWAVPSSLWGMSPDGATLIASDLRRGVIDEATAVVQMFRWTFAPDLCLPEYRDAPRGPIRCFQPHVARFHRVRSSLDSKVADELSNYLEKAKAATKSGLSYKSPLGYFELHYQTSGSSAVPLEDIAPANGIPDFVERCAEYADFSWVTEVGLGFTAPELPSDGTYDIGFQDFAVGTYGLADTSGTTTTIVLHNNFEGGGWPPNNDPDGEPLGRAKATIAHELRHASHYTNNGWTEGLWGEMDAAWAEEIVFPATDDYHNFLDNWSFSQLDAPWVPIDNDNGEGGYEDCLFSHYLSLTYGPQIIVDLWDLRAAAPTDTMTQSFADAMALHSTSWEEAYPRHLEWCWFTGLRATPSFGFPDAPGFWTMEFVESPTAMYPFATSSTVDGLAGHPRRFNKGSATGNPRVVFDGEDNAGELTLSILLVEPSGSLTIVRPVLGPGNTAEYLAPTPFQSLKYLGVIVTNGNRFGEESDYSLQVIDDNITEVPSMENGRSPTVRLDAPAPNPTSNESLLCWSMPRAGLVSLRILDVSGRVVRTLRDRERSPEADRAVWDGRTDRGGLAPAGVYWAVLDGNGQTFARRIVRLR